MFSKVLRDEWCAASSFILPTPIQIGLVLTTTSRTAETAGGGPSSGTYASNPTYELHVPPPSAAQLRFRLQLAAPSPSIALNLTVFNSPAAKGKGKGAGALGRHVATSGPYSDAIAGVVIEQLALQPGRYLVVPSTYKAGARAAFRLIVYSSVAGVQVVPVKKP